MAGYSFPLCAGCITCVGTTRSLVFVTVTDLARRTTTTLNPVCEADFSYGCRRTGPHVWLVFLDWSVTHREAQTAEGRDLALRTAFGLGWGIGFCLGSGHGRGGPVRPNTAVMSCLRLRIGEG